MTVQFTGNEAIAKAVELGNHYEKLYANIDQSHQWANLVRPACNGWLECFMRLGDIKGSFNQLLCLVKQSMKVGYEMGLRHLEFVEVEDDERELG